MATTSTAPESRKKAFRFWPAPLIVAVGVAVVVTVSLTIDDPDDPFFIIPIFSTPSAVATLLAVWWFGFSRAGGRAKWLGAAVAVVTCVAVGLAADRSLTPFQWIWAVPLGMVVAVVYWLVSFPLSQTLRVAGLVGVVVASAVPWLLIRGQGTTGVGVPVVAWRWSQTEEEKYLAERGGPVTTDVSDEPLRVRPDDWVGFRGADRQGHGPEVMLNAEGWPSSPPQLLWRRRVGPGWSSFAVVDGFAFTQEQQGPNEAVACYDLDTGATVWEHTDPVRFEESFGGPGPRATPTYDGGRLYVMGATGLLNCLSARTGERVWSVDVAGKYGSPTPEWAFSASPLVWGERVIVQAGGTKGQPLLVALSTETGEEVWTAGTGTIGHSSPQRATLDGTDQVLAFAGPGLFGFDPESGEELWRYGWETLNSEYKISQPQVIDDTSVVVGMGYGYGTKRLRVARTADGWSVEEVWSSKRLKPKFNDFVYFGGSIFGFNGGRLACLDAESGELNWVGDNYGYGQLVRIGDRLLVLAETGDVAVVEADAGEFIEVGRFRALDGKTWNHPVVAEGKLLVRNDTEAACYRLE